MTDVRFSMPDFKISRIVAKRHDVDRIWHTLLRNESTLSVFNSDLRALHGGKSGIAHGGGGGTVSPMRIIAISRDSKNANWDDAGPILVQEAAHVWQLLQQGTIRDIWFRKPENDAVIILECASVAEAKKVLDGFPLVAAGLIRFSASELAAYDGFQRLFRRNPKARRSRRRS
jgi:muconolactone delta-isomerase